MFVQNRRISRTKWTHFAWHWFFARMLSHMDFPCRFSCWFITAYTAYERFNAIVHGFNVFGECFWCCEFVGTNVTSFFWIPTWWGIFINVNGGHMLSQLIKLLEWVRARWTKKTGQLSVHLKMTKDFHCKIAYFKHFKDISSLFDDKLPAKIALNEQNGHINRSISILCSFHMCAVQSRHIFHSFEHSKHLNCLICSVSVRTWHFSCIWRLSSVSNWKLQPLNVHLKVNNEIRN